MKRGLYNPHHGTEVNLFLAKDGSVSERQLRSAMLATCPEHDNFCVCRQQRLELVRRAGRHRVVVDRLDWILHTARHDQRYTLA